MSRTARLLLSLTAAAIAVPLVPWILWGARLDHAVAAWLDPPPPAPLLAAAEIGVLAADILLPVPSSLVATLGGASLGLAAAAPANLAIAFAWSLAGALGREADSLQWVAVAALAVPAAVAAVVAVRSRPPGRIPAA